uniref:Uncharacterized protein n=1 Tax=Arundo donax TaxID=35708 RepID=A0A0A8XV03_ARUDO
MLGKFCYHATRRFSCRAASTPLVTLPSCSQPRRPSFCCCLSTSFPPNAATATATAALLPKSGAASFRSVFLIWFDLWGRR